jgi:hypothetical protein
MTVITMSHNELTRLRVLIDIADGRLSVADATGLIGVTTRKCSECTTSWTKHDRAARWCVRSTLDGCRSGGGRSHVSDVPKSLRLPGLSRTAAVDPFGTFRLLYKSRSWNDRTFPEWQVCDVTGAPYARDKSY